MKNGFRYFGKIVLCLSLLGPLAACKDDEIYIEKPVDQIYSQAKAAMDADNYIEAAKIFEEVERHHPYSSWATKARLMAAYCYYEALKYDDAIVSLDSFIQMHPGHQDIAYAYYLKGLSYYEQIADVRRDQSLTERAHEAFSELVEKFPESPYAKDASLKLALLDDHLAGKEMAIGRFYLSKGYYQSAITRFQQVIVKYQTTSHTPEALHRLVEAYVSVGLFDEAESVAAVLGYNFPGSEWYEDSYALLRETDHVPRESDRSWISKAWKSLVR